MQLIKDGRIVEEGFARVADEAPVPERLPVVVSAARFLAAADALARREGPTGVLWPNNRNVAELAPYPNEVFAKSFLLVVDAQPC